MLSLVGLEKAAIKVDPCAWKPSHPLPPEASHLAAAESRAEFEAATDEITIPNALNPTYP
jgi:hypothetical protein